MEEKHTDLELDDLLSDLHRLIDQKTPAEDKPETYADDDFDLSGLFDDETFDGLEPVEGEFDLSGILEPAAAAETGHASESEPEPEPTPEPEPELPVSWTEKQKVPRHVAKLQKNQEQAYADWLYEQEKIQDPMTVRWTEKQKVPRHVAKLQKNQEQAYADWLYEQEHRAPELPPEFETEELPRKKRRRKGTEPEPELEIQPEPEMEFQPEPKKKSHGFRNFLIFLLVLSLALLTSVVFLLPKQPMEEEAAGTRRDGVSTILLIGTDAGGARTDSLMLLTGIGRENSCRWSVSHGIRW